MSLLMLRFKYTAQTTISNLLFCGIDGRIKEFSGYTLEDTVRPDNIKVYGHTAIPEGEYELKIVYSPKFKRNVVQVCDVPNFDYIYFHGGNTHKDTSGCILCAEYYNEDKEVIYSSNEKYVFDFVQNEIKENGSCFLTIINKGQL